MIDPLTRAKHEIKNTKKLEKREITNIKKHFVTNLSVSGDSCNKGRITVHACVLAEQDNFTRTSHFHLHRPTRRNVSHFTRQRNEE